ncbi:MAG: hypothetical protein AB7G15_05825 [Alphaproteobacteria bacterium]
MTAFGITVLGGLGLSIADAHAHTIGERYDLPLPLLYFVIGAGAAVALSFAAAAIVLRPGAHRQRAWVVMSETGARAPLARVVRLVLQVFGLAVFALAIAAGLLGDQHPARNIAPSIVWIGWWVGLAAFAALIGNLWPLLNPWRTLFLWFGGRATAPPRAVPQRPIPQRWRAWPAVALLLGFVWFELIFPFGASPLAIAVAALGYAALMLFGMARYGEAWLGRADAFTVLFDLLGRFAPVRAEATPAGTRLVLRFWGGGIAGDPPLSLSMTAFTLLALAAVLFDGFLGTSVWRAIDRAFGSLWGPRFDDDSLIAATVSLIGLWLVFLGAYLGTMALTAKLVGAARRTNGRTEGRTEGRMWAQRYAATLIPIAVGYHVAHNFAYLLVQGQAALILTGDPFGRGWNLFGLAGREPDITVVGAEGSWLAALLAIVGGHLIAVYVAHRIALAELASARKAFAALIPLTALMVVYTCISLTVIAEPLTRFRAPDPSYSAVTATLIAFGATSKIYELRDDAWTVVDKMSPQSCRIFSSAEI